MTERIRIYGIVQGVGFRPFVSRLATEYDISGSVKNRGSFVEIIANGDEAKLAVFRSDILTRAPERSHILGIETAASEPVGGTGFYIDKSEHEGSDIFIPADIAICEKCRDELFDENDRRYLHPFINCTACGPRLTILDEMPYDRERTSMKSFPMCAACEEEYHDPDSRRYDAQPVCCNDCGPNVYILDGGTSGKEAITLVRRTIAAGGIAAVKGIGGFHLAVDASDSRAVKRLRVKKNRLRKPFAVMAKDIEAVRREVVLTDEAKRILTGSARPILLLPRRAGGIVTDEAAPENPYLGVMLPYTPLHLLLFDYADDVKMPDVLIMTSANPPGAPICRTDDDARQSIQGIADIILTHDRRIRVRADDSVVSFAAGAPLMIRRSRGYAPLPVALSKDWEGSVLAVGGELKNTFCIGRGSLFYPSAHIGDMGDIRSVLALRETVARMETLLETRGDVVAYDPHPLYHPSTMAREMGRPLLPVQHHYAHILSCMAENDEAGPVIGVAFDGTGWGDDGTIWGGEFLRADFHGFTRLGSVAPFTQSGGERAVREGWRVAFSILGEGEKDPEKTLMLAGRRRLALASEKELLAEAALVKSRINSVTSTSAGRIFDAVSAILGCCRASTFEGEAAMMLQFLAEEGADEKIFAREHPMDFLNATWGEGTLIPRFSGTERFTLPVPALVGRIAALRLSGIDVRRIARLFHESLAAFIAMGCGEARERTGLDTVALSGGVFQNSLLLSLSIDVLRREGFRVIRHRKIPPNDGGISLGQAVRAMAYLNMK